MQRELFDEEHEQLRASFRAWLAAEVVPRLEDWDRAGIVPRDVFTSAGEHGFLGFDIPEEYGGGGVRDFRNNLVILEEVQAAGTGGAGLGLTLHNDICLPYFIRYCTDEQQARWLPGIASGELITAIAMTEPGIGSDLASMSTTAIRDGDRYVVNGSKTFITNGINADLVITAVKTDPTQRHAGMSLLVLERGMDGFERGRNLDKIGLHAQDTAELYFENVRVPKANLLGEEGEGFVYLMQNLPRERVAIGVTALAGAEKAFEETLEYCRNREAFGRPIGRFQHNRFTLAEMKTELSVARAFTDRCVTEHVAERLSTEEASMLKWWNTELCNRVVDRCLQLHGGYGYMTEYPIAKAYLDSRIQTIFGGTTEIMKEIIGRSLGL
jgi:alkylation response protein AidB-like acyl-CoA dehydrogenase